MVQAICPECGIHFTPTPATRPHFFCSDTCRDLYLFKVLAPVPSLKELGRD